MLLWKGISWDTAEIQATPEPMLGIEEGPPVWVRLWMGGIAPRGFL